jgi:hypothetical protein
LPKPGNTEFAFLLDRFIGEVAQRIEEYPPRFFVGLGGFSECDLQFSFGHLEALIYVSEIGLFQGIESSARGASTLPGKKKPLAVSACP